MKSLVTLFVLYFALHSLALSTQTLSVLPKPNKISVDQNSKIDISLISNWVVFSKSFPQTHIQLNLFLDKNKQKTTNDHTQIIVFLKNNKLQKEEYTLNINRDIVIEASTEQGAFYALQTFKQLYLADQLFKINIKDKPAQVWRANMIDVARHFRSINYLKRHIQLISTYKMNRLHLHLSDDQGFRIQIKTYPKLTAISGQTSVYNDPAGFYSQTQIKDLIDFAKDYHVQIIPEIDIPAHTRAITHAYPELACDGDDTQKYSGTRVLKTKLCLQKMHLVKPFLNAVFNEITQLFESPYVHIGVDEVLLKKGFEDSETQLLTQLYQNIINQLNNQGKTVIAWEEILNFDLSGELIAQLWSGKTHFKTLAQNKQIPVILSLCKYAYFDHGYFKGQQKMTTWCNKDGVTLKNAYDMPHFSSLNVLGIESALWGEFVRTDQRADFRLWPRLLATAESSWSENQQLDFKNFVLRVDLQLPFLKSKNVEFYPHY
ncbi:MAG: family 20 glycosylhydrolase [Saccharospirillaceae bacterium]|nr:beta-N-acetylhexosaminidase [Pseudomonadales bacterium]NRB77883.1 family 20 glycosylhydrolase [Saccharospirillaceae bacterium]